MKATGIVLGAVVLGWIAACGGKADGPGGRDSTGPAGSPVQPFDAKVAAATLAEIACDKASACSPAQLDVSFADIAACRTRTAIGMATNMVAPGASITTAQIATCAAAYRAATCDAFFRESFPTACRFPGTLEDGAACATDGQCRSGGCERPRVEFACGRCQARVPSGGSCRDATCEDGLVCGDDGVCVPWGNLGDACGPGLAPCAPDATCRKDVCEPLLGMGAACVGGELGCDYRAGLSCVGTGASARCVLLERASEDEACGVLGSDVVLCGRGTNCVTASGSARGTCRRRPREPDECAPDTASGQLWGMGRRCEYPAQCNPSTQRCEIFDPASCGR